jgi:hypothetical protein
MNVLENLNARCEEKLLEREKIPVKSIKNRLNQTKKFVET